MGSKAQTESDAVPENAENEELKIDWSELRGRIASLVRKKIRTPEEADDLTHEIFIKIYENLDRLRDSSKLNGWSYKITQNALMDFFRKRAKDPSVDLRENSIALAASSNEDGTVQALVASWLPSFIAALPERDREALDFVELKENSQKELADHLGISVSGAKSRVQRGRERLKEALLECCRLELAKDGTVLDYEKRKETCCGEDT